MIQVNLTRRRRHSYWMFKGDSRLTDVVMGGTQVDPRGQPRPHHVTNPALATWAICPTWPPVSSHYISVLPFSCILYSTISEPTMVAYYGDLCHPPCNTLLKHIACFILPLTGQLGIPFADDQEVINLSKRTKTKIFVNAQRQATQGLAALKEARHKTLA